MGVDGSVFIQLGLLGWWAMKWGTGGIADKWLRFSSGRSTAFSRKESDKKSGGGVGGGGNERPALALIYHRLASLKISCPIP